MAWWRRDPSLWARTPIHRYARRTLRDHEATLRARCFSKTNARAAQHKDDDDNTRPSGMSNLEWMQLQHYRRWKRRFEEDPYRALFGASEDMLSGKGLREWNREWLGRTLPKWMVAEMGLGERGKGMEEGGKKKDGGDKKARSSWPRKVDIEEDVEKEERGSLFRQPGARSSRFERGFWSEGVESPSDSRRPREQPLVRPSSETIGGKDVKSSITASVRQDTAAPKEPRTHIPDLPKFTSHSAHDSFLDPEPIKAAASSKEAAARETSFIEEFLADTARTHEAPSSDKAQDVGWRQTVLDRRATPGFTPEPRRRTDMPVIDVTARKRSEDSQLAMGSRKKLNVEKTPELTSQAGRNLTQPTLSVESSTSWIITNGHVGGIKGPGAAWSYASVSSTNDTGKIQSAESAKEPPNAEVNEWLIEPAKPGEESPDLSTRFAARKSTSEILKDLPKDDMDFLSAADIRASMGRQKTNQEDKNSQRLKLEKDFQAAHNEEQLNPMYASMVVNNQHIRRKERELLRSQKQEETRQTVADEAPKETAQKAAPIASEQKGQEDMSTTSSVSVLETGLDFMSRWLHTGGNALAHHFWQDPVQVVADQNRSKDGYANDPFLKGIVAGVQKGRRAMIQVKEELLVDLPASKPLLDRLTQDERRGAAGAAILLKDRPLDSKMPGNVEERKGGAQDRVRLLRQALLDTDKEYKEACQAVDGMKSDHKPSESLQKRLRMADDVLHKNAKLTRTIIFGLQARFEIASAARPDQRARDLAHRLLALQDTQLALFMLVSRAMQMLGITPKVEKESAVKDPETQTTAGGASHTSAITQSSTSDKMKEARERLRTAVATSKLEAEIKAQQAAMHGLSDDGYARAPKPISRKHFEEPNPLAHSLFRPFGLQLEGLGKEVESEKTAVNEVAKKKADEQLVREVRKAYEDVYGPITVGHRQAADDEEAATNTKSVEEANKNVPEQETEEAPVDAATLTSKPKRQRTIELLKEDEVSPTVSTSAAPTDVAEQITSSNSDLESSGIEVIPKITESKSSDSSSVGVEAAITSQATEPIDDATATSAPATETTASEPTTIDQSEISESPYTIDPELGIETEYQIYTYDAQNDEILITSSPVPASQSQPTPLPVHEALAALSNPSKFLPHLPPGFDVISANANMLVLRPTSNNTSPPLQTVRVPASNDAAETRDENYKRINPIDGTTRLSPTGYVGNSLELEREFEERRRAAGEYSGRVVAARDREIEREREGAKREKKGRGARGGKVGVGGVVKTAIVAAAWCYVVGVIAELMR